MISRGELQAFSFEGRRVPLIAPMSGIWRPRDFVAALSILTTFTPTSERPPYDDHVGVDRYPRYKWRGTNASHADNAGLRRAMELRKPLIWLRGVARSTYQADRVWLAGEEPRQHQFVLALNNELRDLWSTDLAGALPQHPVRRYAERLVQTRLHQRLFSSQVLLAYDFQCALCRLRRRELLDAAHIKEDAAGGLPVVPNGLAMCAIHHRALRQRRSRHPTRLQGGDQVRCAQRS
jgi:putative restriction endonuclease